MGENHEKQLNTTQGRKIIYNTAANTIVGGDETMTEKISLILGGTRSGKTRMAEMQALDMADKKPIYLATGQAFDDEMTNRINRHIKDRDASFTTIEEAYAIADVITQQNEDTVVLIDSIGTWISNLMLRHSNNDKINNAIEDFLAAAESAKCRLIIVSDEVSMGIVPENAAARQFRDHIGMSNQRMARLANSVIFMVAGLPITMKP